MSSNSLSRGLCAAGLCLIAACTDNSPGTASITSVTSTHSASTNSASTHSASTDRTGTEPSTDPASSAVALGASESGRPPLLWDGADGPVEPGRYLIDTFAAPIQVTVPAGWTSEHDFGLFGPDDSHLLFWLVSDVYTDACHWDTAEAGIGPTVDDLADGLVNQRGGATTTSGPIVRNGFTGVEFALTLPDDLDLSACDGSHYTIWTDAVGKYWYESPGRTDNFWIMDLNGQRLAIAYGAPGAMADTTRADLVQLVESLSFG